MRSRALKSMALPLALLATACSQDNLPAAPNTAISAHTHHLESRQEIINLLKRYQQAMRTADLQGIAATLHDEVVTTFQGKLTVRGKSAVMQNYQVNFQTMDFSGIEYLIDEINTSQDLAVISTYHPVGSFVTHKKDRKKIMDHNRELFVLKKVQGQWLIYRYMYNQTPEQAK
ncbi:MAG: nuclear transport factor 2 family protein [Neisseria sp.]|uniref:nuclear transport factor 2 family protein n=1 Tax=Neisseria sp. TaxID=192066 RepID=UPI0026DBED56|nr:nuclear transport factor 2 family protein [Neisseria sp.]MDO4248837.1 nuclear transport factor 2 family protein [Neisseria sp.]